MNTPAHAVLNLVALGGRNRTHDVVPILVGGVLPDVPMFVFYFIEKFVRGTPEMVIWTTRYYDPAWQVVIDFSHSALVILFMLGVARWLRSSWFVACFASMALHVPVDLLLHHDDGYRHLFPASDWRFMSPVSYWDPRHYGDIVAPLEALAVAVALVVLLRRYDGRAARAALGTMAGAYAIYLIFAVWIWA